ncbi:MAG: 3-isopropylmalate dehydratase small subunit [Alphaproteobacteria bacterium]|nr:3-isopropylmalate dehydratase small subunit [Alphaproteobacteria bacterium]
MKPFQTLRAVAAPMPMINIDTDIIIPKQFLKTIKRTGLGVNAFNDLRYDENGNENKDFVLNKKPYRNAEILITGKNFGCGSSREHAPWAIKDFGIQCIIASSFADIFYNNSFKNGILPIELPQEQVDTLMKEVQENPDVLIEINLEKQTITRGNKFSLNFDIDPFRKHCLLGGIDDIDLTLEKKNYIDSYENKINTEKPWI